MAAGTKPNVYVSERLMNPEEKLAQVRKENFTWAAILAILAVLFFVALLALQAIEHSAIKLA